MRPLPSILALALAAMLAGACTSGGEPAAGPSATASPTTSPAPTATGTTTPPPQATPVAGSSETRLMPVSEDPVVFGGNAPETDNRYVKDFVRRITVVLDEHLTNLQNGGKGTLGSIGAEGLVDGSSSAAILAVTRGLVPEGAVVKGAHYEFLVAVDQLPEWARATVEVTTTDGHNGSAQFVFVTSGGSGPKVVAAGPTDTGRSR